MKAFFLKSLYPIRWIVLVVPIVLACQDDDDKTLTPEQKQQNGATTAQDNTQIIVAAQEVMDITDDALIEEGVTVTARGKRPEWNCRPSINSSFSINNSNPDSVIYSGSLTIDYGDGSTCEDSTRIRRGKIIDNFVCVINLNEGITISKTQTITFEGFYKDSVQFDGTFTTTNISRDSSILEIDDARITYADGTDLTWSGTLTFTRGENDDDDEGERFNNNGSVIITGSLTGVTRAGLTFSSTITEGIVYTYACSSGYHHKLVPVSGTVEIVSDGTTSIVDYGNGECDRIYTVTTNGETTEHTFEKGHP